MARIYLATATHNGTDYRAINTTMKAAAADVVAQVRATKPDAIVAYMTKRITAAERDALLAEDKDTTDGLVYQGELTSVKEIAQVNMAMALDQADSEYDGDYDMALASYAINARDTVLEAGGTAEQAQDAHDRCRDAGFQRFLAKGGRKRAEDSFDRCDTDGFLSQWASNLGAQEHDRQAEIILNGGVAEFIGLYEGTRRVKARKVQVANRYTGGTDTKWVVEDDDPICAQRKWIPTGSRSRVQKRLGLHEQREVAPAKAAIRGSGTGLSGTAWVATVRTGCPYGSDATLVQE